MVFFERKKILSIMECSYENWAVFKCDKNWRVKNVGRKDHKTIRILSIPKIQDQNLLLLRVYWEDVVVLNFSLIKNILKTDLNQIALKWR